MAILNTRLRLKYDTWENWTKNNFHQEFIPLRGEVCVVEIPGSADSTGKVTQKPSILFKVGDGTTTFDQLDWASGLAADVYAWAKKEYGLAGDIYCTAPTVENGVVTDSGVTVAGAISELEAAVEALEAIFSEEGEDGTITGISGIIENYINNKLNYTDTAVADQYVSAVSQTNGVIKVTRAELPKYTLTTGDANGTVKFNGTDVAVKGLGTAAYKNAEDFDPKNAAAEVRGTEADTAGTATVHGALKSAAAAQQKADEAVTNIENLAGLVGDLPEGITATTVVGYAEEVAEAAANEKIASVTAGNNSVTIGGTATEPTVAVNISADSDNAITLEDDGLKVVIPAAAEYTIVKETIAEEGYAATYKLFKGETSVGASINIPKDMVVSSGSVVELAEGEVEDLSAGTYIKLVLANANDDTLYIPVGSLIEYVTSGSQNGDMVFITIDETTHKVTATITDGTITKDKLVASVQTSLGKADSAVQKIETGTSNGTIKVDGAEVEVAGLKSAAYASADDFAAANILESLDSSITVANTSENGEISVLTGVTQENGMLTGHTETKLAKVASTGSIYDVVETEKDLSGEDEVDCFIFYGGSATELIKNY